MIPISVFSFEVGLFDNMKDSLFDGIPGVQVILF